MKVIIDIIKEEELPQSAEDKKAGKPVQKAVKVATIIANGDAELVNEVAAHLHKTYKTK